MQEEGTHTIDGGLYLSGLVNTSPLFTGPLLAGAKSQSRDWSFDISLINTDKVDRERLEWSMWAALVAALKCD